MFLDEPMSGLDPLGRRDVRALMLELRDQGRTIFFSSHILSDAEALCSQRRDRRQGPAGRQRAAGRPAGVRGSGLGAGDVRACRPATLDRVRAARATRDRRSPAIASSSICRPTRSPSELLARADGRRAPRSCRSIRCARRSRTVRPARRRRGRRGARGGGRACTRVRCVAVAVFRESVRDRVFYNLVLFAVLLVGASILIGQLTAGQDVKIIKDLGLAATSLFGLFIAIFVGINLVSKEVDRRSVYPLLAKPVRRSEFIVGKYCRPAADAARQHHRDDGGALRRAVLSCRAAFRRASSRPGTRRRSIRRCSRRSR